MRSLEDNPTWLLVVAAALVDDDGRMLMHRRPYGKSHAGLWEFPGGKVEPAEFPTFALAREIYEELGIFIEPGSLEPVAFAQTAEAEQDIAIVILLYIVRQWSGVPVAQEGGVCQWFELDAAARLAMPPLDQRLFALLRTHLTE